MSEIGEHLSMLTKFALGFGLAILLPKLMTRLKLPPVLGFIGAGVVLGPSALNVLDPEGPSIVLLSEIGKLLFMFFVGFEIDLKEFNRTRARSLTFGVLTFLLPLALGTTLARFLGNGWNTSLLVGSLIASHTLLAYPLLQRLGLAQHPVVAMVVGGTILTDIAAMLVLAVTVSVHVTGFSWAFLGAELLELAFYVPLVIFGAGAIARRAILRFGEKANVRVMILLVVIAVCGELAHAIKLEGIVGAFLAGIAVKRAVRGKFAVEHLEITAHAVFIPVFFVATGFLVDFTLIGRTLLHRPILVIGIIAALVVGKFLAAFFSVRAVRGTLAETALAWSISLPQMAATLASAVVAYKTVNAAGEHLLGEGYVNAILVLVVLTCVVGPIFSERIARRIERADKSIDTAALPPDAQPGAPW